MFNINIGQEQKKQQKKQAVIFIDRERCTFITYPSRTINVFGMGDNVSYGEVVSRTGLVSSFASFVQANSILPCECVLVVSKTATFESTFKKNQNKFATDKQDELAFLESVPYERVIVARLTNLDQSQTVVATNKDLVGAITLTLQDIGFEPLAVLPYQIIGQRKVTTTGNAAFDLFELGRYFLDKAQDKGHDKLEFNILENKKHHLTEMSVSEAANTELSPLAIGLVMAGFFAIAAGVVWYSIKGGGTPAPQPNVNVQTAPQSQVAKSSGTTNTTNVLAKPDGEVTPVPEGKQKLQVLYTPKLEQEFLKVKTELETKAGVFVEGQNDAGLEDSGNVALFNSTVSDTLQSLIVSVLKDNGFAVTAKTAKVADYAGVINLSSSSKPNVGVILTPTTTP